VLSGVSSVDANIISSNKNCYVISAEEQFDLKRTRLKEMLRSELMQSEKALGLFTDTRIVLLSGELIWRLIKNYQPKVLIGAGLSGMPLLHAVALAANSDGHAVQVLMVREQRKTHNLKKWVEGAAPAERAAAIYISDHFADAGTLSFVESALEADNCIVDIQAISTMLDLTAYADLSYADFETKNIISIFSPDEFHERGEYSINKLLVLAEKCRLQTSSLQGTV